MDGLNTCLDKLYMLPYYSIAVALHTRLPVCIYLYCAKRYQITNKIQFIKNVGWILFTLYFGDIHIYLFISCMHVLMDENKLTECVNVPFKRKDKNELFTIFI